MSLYDLAVLGNGPVVQFQELEAAVARAVEPFGLRLGREISWSTRPRRFEPEQRRTAAAVYFGSEQHDGIDVVADLVQTAVPVLPVVSRLDRVSAEIPEILRPFNALEYGDGSRVATALLECCGLLPRQRRVFLSYKRSEARAAALQLFDELSARVFDVFLDTHGVPPGADFQNTLWHRLCDSDVLVMLDTPTYFASRWTAAEFGRALAKDIVVLRVAWPDLQPSRRTETASTVALAHEEVDIATGRLADAAVSRICSQLEELRSEGHAVRSVNLVSNLRIAITKVGGRVSGVGLHKGVHLELPDGGTLTLYPTVGVPTAVTLHDAAINCAASPAAVVYDSVGLDPKWLEHLDWLGTHVHDVRWVKVHEAAWAFADWRG